MYLAAAIPYERAIAREASMARDIRPSDCPANGMMASIVSRSVSEFMTRLRSP